MSLVIYNINVFNQLFLFILIFSYLIYILVFLDWRKMGYFKRIFISILVLLLVLVLIYIVSYVRFDKVKEVGGKQIKLDNKNVFSGNSKANRSLNDIVGYLTIDKIEVKKDMVKNGVTEDILSKSIGHFSNTAIFNGNVCLAAHNYGIRGSNLFKDLDKLRIGDKIIYVTEFGRREYKVIEVKEISSRDFSVLENSSANMLTLITCINNKKDSRLCVKALQLKEE